MPVTLTPVDGALIPLAKSYPAVTRDISTGGVSLVTSQVVEADFLMLDLFPPETARIHLLAKALEFREFHTAILIRAALIMRLDR